MAYKRRDYEFEQKVSNMVDELRRQATASQQQREQRRNKKLLVRLFNACARIVGRLR